MKATTPRFKEQYDTVIVPALMKELGLTNRFAAPRLTKITVNVGTGRMLQKDSKATERVVENIAALTGQKPVVVKARKSVAAFKLRAGQPVGVSVTLRGPRMYEFLDRLISVVLPRVRDFRGLSPKAFDGQGNYSIGVKEHVIFPEPSVESIENTHGLQINIGIKARQASDAKALLDHFGMPFQKKN